MCEHISTAMGRSQPIFLLSILSLSQFCSQITVQGQRFTSTTRRNIYESTRYPTSTPRGTYYLPSTTTSDYTDIDFEVTSSTQNWNNVRPSTRQPERPSHGPPSVDTTIFQDDTIVEPEFQSHHVYDIQNLRRLKFVFKCNATYPIQWISPNSVGESKWEVDELRHFERFNKTKRRYPNNYHAQRESYKDNHSYELRTIYTVILTLRYKNQDLELVPNSLLLFCMAAASDFNSLDEIPDDKLRLFLNKDDNGKLKISATVGSTFPRNETTSYRDVLGTNKGCTVHLDWNRRKFQCSSDMRNAVELTYNDDPEKCYDEGSCVRSHSIELDGCSKEVANNPTTKFPEAVFGEGKFPAYGFILCRRSNTTERNDSTTAALHFYHSLPEICPGDDDPSVQLPRNKLYVGRPLPEHILHPDSISFCSTHLQSETKRFDRPVLMRAYVGENVTVSCVLPSYYFAKGTRIGLVYRNSNRYIYNPTNVYVIGETVEKSKGLLNYTAIVLIRNESVEGVLCEGFRKQSKSTIKKILPIDVKVTKNISFVTNWEPIQANTPKLFTFTGQENFEIECEAVGDPLPEISWNKDSKIISSSADYQINSSTVIDDQRVKTRSVIKFAGKDSQDLTGTYTCQATNSIRDSASRTFVVGNENEVREIAGLKDDNTVVIVISIVIPLLIVILIVVGLLVWKIKRQGQKLQLLTKAEVDEFLFGKPEFLQHHSSTDEVNNYAAFLPYNRGYEISKDQLVIDENGVLGSGAYAIVLLGTLTRNGGTKVKVAIKTARAMDDVTLFKALLSELKIMGFIGTHPNIVNLVGAHTSNIQNREIFIAIEYCQNGNLLGYLRDHRNQIKNLVHQNPKGEYEMVPGELNTVTRDSILNPIAEINTVTLIKWAYEISNGMDFLSKKKVIHGDLAARNILLDGHLIAKIGDFGLSRQLFEYANYFKKQQSPLPWKWLAIESLQDMRFSVKSDVWSYGILLYELFSLGQVPYPGHSYNDEFLEALIEGKRPNRPSHADSQVYDFMKSCWREKSDERPNFTAVRHFFQKLLYQLVPPEYIELHDHLTETVSASACAGPIVPQVQVLSSKLPSCSKDLGKLGGDEGKSQSRFSFNTKTLSARFNRN